MTIDEQLRERLNWKREGGTKRWIGPKGQIQNDPPRWSKSYDAIHRDLLPRLTDYEWRAFVDALDKAIPGRLLRWVDVRNYYLATPAQLCEAFLEATK